jgi:hypothetical protein
MQNEKSQRYAAVAAAKDAVISAAKNRPQDLMNGMLKHPHLLYGIQNVGEIFDILLEKGMTDQLNQLAGSVTLPKQARAILVAKLVFN